MHSIHAQIRKDTNNFIIDELEHVIDIVVIIILLKIVIIKISFVIFIVEIFRENEMSSQALAMEINSSFMFLGASL